MPSASRSTAVAFALVCFTLPITSAPPVAAAASPVGTLSVDAPSGTVAPGTVVFRGSYQGAGAIDQHVSYAVDVSGSTASSGNDCNGDGSLNGGDDFNGDGTSATTLDCEIAGVVALNSSLRNRLRPLDVSLVAFGSGSAIADMTPDGDDDAETKSTADNDSDRIPDVQQVAASLNTGALELFRSRSGIGSGTNFDSALDRFKTLVSSSTPPAGSRGQYTLFFLSDGQAGYPSTEVEALKQLVASRSDLLPVVVNTVSVGSGGSGCASSSPLRQIADNLSGTCTDVQPAQLQAVLGETKPLGLDRIEVTFAGSTRTASVDALGGWNASFPDVPASFTDYPYAATAFRDDGTTDVKNGSVSVQPGKLRYVALGDSYSSGWGLVPYFRPSDTNDPNHGDSESADPVSCGRSPLASMFSLTLPHALVTINHDARVDSTFRACGSAVSVQLVGHQQHSGEAGPQLRFVDDATDLVTLTIGGNDVNFANVMTTCGANIGSKSDCQNESYLRLNSGRTLTLDEFTDLRLALAQLDVLDALRQVRAKAPNATVVVGDYPHLLAVDAPGTCQEEAAFSRGERQWIASGVDRMGAAIELAARQAGVFSISVIDDFGPHEKCGGGDDWMYGVEASGKKTGADDEVCTTMTTRFLGRNISQTGCFYKRSFHPRREGAAAYGRAYTALLADKSTSPPNGLTRSGLPRNPQPALPVARRAAAHVARDEVAARVGLSAEEESEVRGFTADAASVSDLPEIQGTITPNQCNTQLRVLPGQVVVVSGAEFEPGTLVTPSITAVGALTTLDAVTVDADGNATVALIMPLDLGNDSQIGFTLRGTGVAGFQRVTTTALVNGHADSDCIAAQRRDGLLSENGTSLPPAAASFWDRSQLTPLTSSSDPATAVPALGLGENTDSTPSAEEAIVETSVPQRTQLVTFRLRRAARVTSGGNLTAGYATCNKTAGRCRTVRVTLTARQGGNKRRLTRATFSIAARKTVRLYMHVGPRAVGSMRRGRALLASVSGRQSPRDAPLAVSAITLRRG